MTPNPLRTARFRIMTRALAGLGFACFHPVLAQAPDAAINGSPVGYFSYGGRFDSSFDGVDQIYSHDAGLTLFLDDEGYGFTGEATLGSTGTGKVWNHLGTTQLTPNSYRDDLRVVTEHGDVDIEQVVSYFPESGWINIDVTLTNHSSFSFDTTRLIYAADTYINGDDGDDLGVEDFDSTRSIGIRGREPEPSFSGLSGFRSIGDPGIGLMNYFAGNSQAVWNVVRSGSLSDRVDAEDRSRDQGIALSFDRAGSFGPGEKWTVRLQWIYRIPQAISLSSCNVTSPTPRTSNLGDLTIVFDGNNINANPIDCTFEYSTDGDGVGDQTWNPCSASASSMLANPDEGRGTPFVGASFIWDPVADGVGINEPQVVDLRVVVADPRGGDAGLFIVDDITIEQAAPGLSPIGAREIAELDVLNFTAVANPGVSPMVNFGLEDGIAGAVPSGAGIDPETGVFTWSPSELQGPGEYRFDVVVTGSSGSDRETITVSVTEVNLEPVLSAIGNRAVNEGSALVFNAVASDPDAPANMLSFSLAAGTSGAVPAGAMITPAGAFSWTPTEAQGPGSFTFDVVVIDSGLPALSDRETITVSVGEVNRAPVLAAIGNRSVDEGSGLAFTAAATDPDSPVNALSFSLAAGPSGAVPAGAVITAGGAFSWTPTEEQGPGSFTFDVVVIDNGLPTLSDRETITVSVAEVNRAPVLAAIGNRAVDEELVLAFTAAATDPDSPVNALSFSLAAGPSGAVPAGAVITPGGAFSWTPTEEQGPGSFTFDVVVIDNGLPTLSDRETITVSVAEINRAPVLAGIGSRSIDEGSALAFSATASDPDSPANTLSFSLAAGPSGAVPAGAAITAGGAFSWTPTEDQGPGSFTFDVIVTDSGLPALSDRETITVTVANIADPTATIISSTANPSVFGQTLSITTTVNPPTGDARVPSGTVQLRDGATLLGSMTLVNGQASFPLVGLSVAAHALSATYLGDAEFQGSISTVLEQTVEPADTRSTLASDSNPSAFGQDVNFTANVAAVPPGAGIPSGDLEFFVDGIPAGRQTLISGSAAIAIAGLSVGSHEVTIEYGGSASFLPSPSTALVQVVGKAASKAVVVSSNNPSRLGEPVTLTAAVSVEPPGAGMPAGTVRFLDGAVSLGEFPLGSDGTVDVSLDTLAIGNHAITVQYSGDPNTAGNVSAPLDQLVNLPKFTITGLAAEQVEGTTPGTGPVDLTFTVTKNEPSPDADGVSYVVAGVGANPVDTGSDFDAPLPAGFPSGSLSFGTAAGSQVLSLRVRADDLFEPDEAFIVTLSNSTGPSIALTSASGAILNDDNPRLSIVASRSVAPEDLVGSPGVFTVSRNGTYGPMSFGLQLAAASTAAHPADFTLGNVANVSGGLTATIPAGASSLEITLTAVDDIAAEAAELATLNLIPSPDHEISGSGSASITIPASDLGITRLADFDPVSFPNGGEGTLRQAILNANLFPGPDVITIDPSVSGTLFLENGELRVLSDLSIIGPGAGLVTISGDLDQSGGPTPGDTRVFRVDDGDHESVIDVALSGLTITGGMAYGKPYPANAGGGILNQGESLYLDQVTISRNAAAFGAGIENTGELLLLRSTVSNNEALELGGGIDNYEAGLEVRESTISGNSAGFGGGGIENSGNVVIHGSALVGNVAVKLAGAIDNFGGNLEIANSTVSGNEAQIGGGLVHEAGLMTFVNCTVVDNTASLSLDANVGGGVFVADTADSLVEIVNSIVAGNVRLFNATIIASDVGGVLVRSGSSNNLIGDAASAGGLIDGQQGNLVGIGGAGVRPLASIVSPLASNGGMTRTHALVRGSPAIDAGDNALAVWDGSIPLEFDQRGGAFPRVAEGRVDIGSYEKHFSEFRITDVTFDPEQGVGIAWIAEIGEHYEILRSIDLIDWTVVGPAMVATSELAQWTDPDPPGPSAFYLVRSR